jgi:hypothetical protein
MRLGYVQEIADADSGLDHDGAGRAVDLTSIIHREVFVQQDHFGGIAPNDPSPDGEERICDFLTRHGGAGPLPKREGWDDLGAGGWYEVAAADGYRLRCEWSQMGGRAELRYFEISPKAHAGKDSPG